MADFHSHSPTGFEADAYDLNMPTILPSWTILVAVYPDTFNLVVVMVIFDELLLKPNITSYYNVPMAALRTV